MLVLTFRHLFKKSFDIKPKIKEWTRNSEEASF